MRVLTDARQSAALLARLVDECTKAIGFTGAGISTECGIPDFRSPDSAWRRHAPIAFEDFLAREDMRVEAWRRKFAMDDLYRGAAPGRGHRALARLVRAGRMEAVITQNIDGLHQSSGLAEDEVIELHGNGGYAKCLACDVRHQLAPIRAAFEASGKAPRCPCGGLIKSATISFGQNLPRAALERAFAVAQDCDLFVAIGSSLVVQPAASLPAAARECGARVVIVNREPTAMDDVADVALRGEIGEILDPLCRSQARN
jgi:NAD-dependent deacetylase